MEERTTFADSQFMDYSEFEKLVKLKYPILYDSEIKDYYEQIKKFYTQDNVRAYNNWSERILSWLKMSIQNSGKFKMALCRVDN